MQVGALTFGSLELELELEWERNYRGHGCAGKHGSGASELVTKRTRAAYGRHLSGATDNMLPMLVLQRLLSGPRSI